MPGAEAAVVEVAEFTPGPAGLGFNVGPADVFPTTAAGCALALMAPAAPEVADVAAGVATVGPGRTVADPVVDAVVAVDGALSRPAGAGVCGMGRRSKSTNATGAKKLLAPTDS